MNNTYDFIVVGAGISACTFASFLNKRFPGASILLVEQGRRLGGRSTTRKSRKKSILEFDHGLPSISFSQPISQDIHTLILPLINSKKLIDISNDILMMNEFGRMDYISTHKKIYRSVPFMINFCEEIINQSINPNKIYFSFQTCIKSIKRINNLWRLEVSSERFLRSKVLILSSSLLAHPRCFDILKIKSLPLRHAFRPGQDEIVDSILNEIKKQNFIKRKIYIFYVCESEVVKNFNHKYLQIHFSKVIIDDLNFERIIFQGQSDGSMIIALHCSYINIIQELDCGKIIRLLITIFLNYQKFIDLFLQAKIIDKMDWRASQPMNNLLSKDLQWSSFSKIGFCGDWFDLNNLGGVESAINSAIRLSNLLDFN